MVATKDKVTELERQNQALWKKIEGLEKQASDDKLELVKWKTTVQVKLETKNDILERWIWATFGVTVLAVVAIIIQFSFDFIKRGGL